MRMREGKRRDEVAGVVVAGVVADGKKEWGEAGVEDIDAALETSAGI